ncbi:Os02g0577900 [Oryza sativa Japonica Group]|uniref:Os02g0577900 protein n=2 Tax=Oryza sativa subsp. japonica TaxID=39947 RepID=C7IYR6_ORYSJ|nr:Os02g0577900 [Oryza sativa Japonica Group]BAS79395.1 Os02g0577900 [Oryza sativa Japonica Group]|eukprot:NP_001173035.1 Os02g0577900 [Oryza sativa Japonica Group]
MPPASSAPTVSAAVSSAGEPPMVKEWLRLLGHLVTGCSPRQRCLGKLRGRAVDAGQGHVLVDLLAAAAGDACDRGRRVDEQRAAHYVGDRGVAPQRRQWGGATMRLRWRSIPSSIRIMRS